MNGGVNKMIKAEAIKTIREELKEMTSECEDLKNMINNTLKQNQYNQNRPVEMISRYAATNKKLHDNNLSIYRAKRKNYRKPTINPEIKSAVRLDVRRVAEPSFPYAGQKLDAPWKIFSFAYEELRDRDQEQFVILHLNSQLILNCIQIIPGTIDSANPYIREIIKTSLLSASNNIVLIHNHPSGNPEFSDKDNNFTREIRWVAETMDIKLIDHVLITGSRYKSFIEEQQTTKK